MLFCTDLGRVFFKQLDATRVYEPCTLAAAELQSLHVLIYYITLLTTCTHSARIYVTRDDVMKETFLSVSEFTCVGFILRFALECTCRWIFPLCVSCC